MTANLPSTWAKSKSVPTSTITIIGQGGDQVAVIEVTGNASVTTSWPYTYQTSQT